MILLNAGYSQLKQQYAGKCSDVETEEWIEKNLVMNKI